MGKKILMSLYPRASVPVAWHGFIGVVYESGGTKVLVGIPFINVNNALHHTDSGEPGWDTS